MKDYSRYIQMAKDMNIENALLIKPEDIFFDIRAILKCRWGCVDYFKQGEKCSIRDTSFEERMKMINAYRNILLLHSHDAREISWAVFEIERAAFLDGYYFAFGIRYCMLCKNCAIEKDEDCPTPEKVRPCEQSFGIDVYKTARKQKLPCDVLKNVDEPQNRYGFVLID